MKRMISALEELRRTMNLSHFCIPPKKVHLLQRGHRQNPWPGRQLYWRVTRRQYSLELSSQRKRTVDSKPDFLLNISAGKQGRLLDNEKTQTLLET